MMKRRKPQTGLWVALIALASIAAFMTLSSEGFLSKGIEQKVAEAQGTDGQPQPNADSGVKDRMQAVARGMDKGKSPNLPGGPNGNEKPLPNPPTKPTMSETATSSMWYKDDSAMAKSGSK